MLVRAMRYGDVRSTDTTALGEVATSLLVRIEAALPAAVTGLGDEAAEALRDRVEEVHAATALMSADQRGPTWFDTLERLTRRADLHGLLAGRFVRLLADAQVFDATTRPVGCSGRCPSGRRRRRRRAWIEGFLAGGGLLLVHDTALLGTLDAWLAGLRPEEFVDVLPLLRRTFGGFQTAERRQLAHQLRRLDGAGSTAAARETTEWSDADLARATPGRGHRGPPPGSAVPARGRPMTAERLRRWRLTLGEDSADASEDLGLSADDQRMDEALAALYGGGRQPGDGSSTEPRTGGLGGSAPRVATWLGDIRAYFPSSVVQVMQRDAIDRLGVRALLLEPELMESLEPDVHLVSTLISLGSAIPETSKATARHGRPHRRRRRREAVANRTRAAVTGALNRAARTHRPKLRDIDWNRTIAKNLKHYLPEQRTVVPERLVGYGRRQQHVERDIILAIDQSGSMAASVVYASIFGAVIASLRAVRTSLVVFDTAVVDLTEELSDPVELLFATQLGGGTDINRAIAYCQGLVTRPTDTVFVLISDLFEGGVRDEMLARVEQLRDAGVVVVVLLALSDEGAPAFDRALAGDLAELGVPAFAVHARTRSPTCWRSPWSAATSGPGRRNRSSTSAG